MDVVMFLVHVVKASRYQMSEFLTGLVLLSLLLLLDNCMWVEWTVNITDRHCKRKKAQRNTCCPCQIVPQSPKSNLAVFLSAAQPEAPDPVALCHVRAQSRYSQVKGNNGPEFGLLFVTVPIKGKLHGSLHGLDFGSFSTVQFLHFCHAPLPRSFCGRFHRTLHPPVQVLISLHIWVLSFQLLLPP